MNTIPMTHEQLRRLARAKAAIGSFLELPHLTNESYARVRVASDDLHNLFNELLDKVDLKSFVGDLQRELDGTE